MNKATTLVAAVIAVAAIGGELHGETYIVPGDYPTIQAAILAAIEGDEVVVLPGTYNEAVFFNGHNITLRSSEGPDNTYITAAGLNNHAVRCILGETTATVLEGFTLTFASIAGGDAAGLNCSNSNPTVINCRFTQNKYGIRNVYSDPVVVDCIFEANVRGMSNTGSNPTVVNCRFMGDAPSYSMAMHNNYSDPTVTNCLFTGYYTASDSVFWALSGSNLVITNCTFSNNAASFGGGVISTSGATVTLINCVIWNNGSNPLDGSGISVIHSDVEFGWPGSDFCILADPVFVDPVNGDFRLAPGSPCIDAGSNLLLPGDITTDLDGNVRFVDDPDTPDCPQPGANCGDPPVVDMGAYEFGCPWDLDDNGIVNVVDFLALLAVWGQGGVPADFDGGGVGVSDFLILLANWGPCP